MDRSQRQSLNRNRTRQASQRPRRRPGYVTLFIDHLRRFHETQVKYAPVARGPAAVRQPLPQPQVPPQSQRSQRRAGPGPQLADFVRNAPQSAVAGSDSVRSSTTSKYLSGPSGSIVSEQSQNNDTSVPANNRQSPVGFQMTPDPGHPTSETFNQHSPQDVQPASPEPVEAAMSPGGATTTAAAATQTEPQVAQDADALPPSPEAPKPEDIRLVQKQLEMLRVQNKTTAAKDQSPATMRGGPGSQVTESSAILARSPKLKSYKFFTQSAGKDSTYPSLTQTPPAAVGGSNPVAMLTQQQQQQKQQQSQQQSQQQKVLVEEQDQIVDGNTVRVTTRTPLTHLSAEQKKKISLSRTIAEQTPNALQTLGPGFQISMPGEKSRETPPKNTNSTTNSKLEPVPSDYEHIYHYASNLVDAEPPQRLYPKKQEEKQQQQPHPPPPPSPPPPPRKSPTIKNIGHHYQPPPQPHLPPTRVVKQQQLNLPVIGAPKTLKRHQDKRVTTKRASPVTKRTK